MNKEEMQNNYIEMLIQDLEKHSFDYWESTQDEMVEALRNLQQKVNQLETNIEEAISIIQNDTTLNPERQRKRLIEMLKRVKE